MLGRQIILGEELSLRTSDYTQPYKFYSSNPYNSNSSDSSFYDFKIPLVLKSFFLSLYKFLWSRPHSFQLPQILDPNSSNSRILTPNASDSRI